MIELHKWLLVLAATIAVVIVPGPTVTVIVANSLRAGAGAGLLNVAGTQLGLAVMVGVLAAGFAGLVDRLGLVFEIVRVVGAAYLVWLGIRMFRSDGTLGSAQVGVPRRRAGYVWQGLLVIWSNPKALFFFGAFIPQFVDATRPAAPQVIALGLTFMVVATVLDAMYAVLAGSSARWLSRRNVRALERVSGTCLIGGGLWLALGRR